MVEIKISNIIRVLRCNKKRFLINAVVAFVLASAYILCIPRYYIAEVQLAPETESSSGLGSLSSLAASFGFNIDAVQSADAISPELYPLLFESTDFIVQIMDIQVYADEKEKWVDYYTYLTECQKYAPWEPAFRKIKRLFKSKKKRTGPATGEDGDVRMNPFQLSENEFMTVESVKHLIQCSVDKKTDVISITVQDQSPFVSACLADSVKNYLQDFITEYRTNKASTDADYYARLCDQAQMEYEKALKAYASFADAHSGSTLKQSYQTRRDDLENDMQAKLTTLVALRQQWQAAQAKVQERVPVFTTIQNASVPIKPAGPKRMIFVAFVVVLSLLGTYIWLVRKQIGESLGLVNEDNGRPA